MAGGGGQVTVIIANLTVGPDAAEAGLSALGEEPVRRKLCPTMGGKAPQKEFLMARKSKEDQEVLAWHSCSSGDLAVPKEH